MTDKAPQYSFEAFRDREELIALRKRVLETDKRLSEQLYAEAQRRYFTNVAQGFKAMCTSLQLSPLIVLPMAQRFASYLSDLEPTFDGKRFVEECLGLSAKEIGQLR